MSDPTGSLVARLSSGPDPASDDTVRLCDMLVERAAENDKAVEAIRAVLSDAQNPLTALVLERLAWADQYANLGDQLAREVTSLVHDPEPTVRLMALRAARFLGVQSWRRLAFDAAVVDDDKDIREYASELFEDRPRHRFLYGLPVPLPVWLAAAVAARPEAPYAKRGVTILVRVHALLALFALARKGPTPHLRDLATRGLVHLHAYEYLEALLSSRDPRVKAMATAMLRREGSPETARMMWLSDDPSIASAGHQRLSGLGQQALPQLAELVAPDSPPAHALGAVELAAAMTPCGGKVLRKALEHGDAEVVARAKKALKALAKSNTGSDLAWQVDADSMR